MWLHLEIYFIQSLNYVALTCMHTIGFLCTCLQDYGNMLHWIAELTQPLQELLCSKNAWVWNPPSHESAFHKVKREITKLAILCHYNPNTKQRYAQVEKKILPIIWACERFSTIIIGKNFEIETDHKLLVPLLSSKHLDTLPPRILRF